MKIENKEVSIKIGRKELSFKNLILDSYLDLFSDSFLDFKNKDLPYCLINLTKTNNFNEKSIEMQYDTILESKQMNNAEIFTEDTIINKYYYDKEVQGQPLLNDFLGHSIREIGFASYDENTDKYMLYACLDVSRYNITIQDNQPVIISRMDKITSDMKMWTNNTIIKTPVHLTKKGIQHIENKYISKLYSIGFGILPYEINKEYTVDCLCTEKTGAGKLKIVPISKDGLFPKVGLYPSKNLYPQKKKVIKESFANYLKESLVPKKNLYPHKELYPKGSTYEYLIYKFRLYEITEESCVATEYYYNQYKKMNKYGKLELTVTYERS